MMTNGLLRGNNSPVCGVPYPILLSKIRTTFFSTKKFTDKPWEVRRCYSSVVQRHFASVEGTISLIPVNCYQQSLMQKPKGSSWLSLSWEFLWEWGVLGAVLFHIFFKFLFLYFLNCEMTWLCCMLFKVFPSAIFGTSALGCWPLVLSCLIF